ncbi:MAG: hypothetical protein MUF84_09560 [Anaerolineae bacterium]|nr:hypothetical protein [Anaerolineae bacterium]
MDLFEAFPLLAASHVSTLKGRTLRLISVAGFVYDERSFHFELGPPRYWGKLASGAVSVGVGAVKLQPDHAQPLYRALIRHVWNEWRVEAGLHPPGHTFVLGEDGDVEALPDVAADIPYLFVLTKPRLGGGDIPDALVQAVYLLPVRRAERLPATASVLRVARSALVDFLAPESWSVTDIAAQPWAELLTSEVLPEGAHLQPVLALRGLRSLFEGAVLPGMPLA